MLELRLLSISFVLVTAVAGCGSDGESEEAFTFGEADMRAAVVGDWTGTVTFGGEPATTYDMTLVQAPPSAQSACDSRTFSVAQCVATSSINLEGTITTADGTFDATALTGDFFVMGLDLSNGELSLSGGGTSLHAQYDGSAFTSGTIAGAQEGSFDLKRK